MVNPAAGGHPDSWDLACARDHLVRLGLDFEFAETARRGAAADLARRAVHDHWPLVVAVGGDGTVNEVVNGLSDESGRPLGTLGAIVTGRGRDVCRNLRVASDPAAATRRLVEGEEVLVDLGVVEAGGDTATSSTQPARASTRRSRSEFRPDAALARFPVSWTSREPFGRIDRCPPPSISTSGARGPER